jgi:hypothetical protein
MATKNEALEQRLPATRAILDLTDDMPASVGVAKETDGGWSLRINLQSRPNTSLPAYFGNVPAHYWVSGKVVLLNEESPRRRVNTAAVD